ncbi:MAG: type II toxin-antitoxin system HicB family antitoxin [Proteobacteria bacterium]|nr:type II toxin-antitoxin system HicB family antitoxin [Pseudomonadota bacterium]
MNAQNIEEAVVLLEIEELDEGGFVATSPDVPGLVAQGRTLGETIDIAKDVARKIAESCLEHGDPLPLVFQSATKSKSLSFSVPVAVP